MTAEARVIKGDGDAIVAMRNAKLRSYMGARSRLGNARAALQGAIAEFESAIKEVDETRMDLDHFLVENGED